MTVMAAGRRAGNIPAELTSFVGRRREVAEVRRLLSVSRLVTLTGVGGVGKTRLALRAAAEFRRAFDETWLVDLAGLVDPALVVPTVAATVGLCDQSERPPLSVLSDFLAPKRMLLVLDNCEHLLDACAEMADALLRAAPELRVLATSRQSLRIEGEFTMAVAPLPVPARDELPLSPEALGQYEAVSLFADRAAAVLPGFTLDDGNAMAVVRLCQQLDGIPLAIELAAVRLRALSVAEIEDRLGDRYGLLTGGSRAALPRQRTLRALVDWSFGLLSATERQLWARLSVFTGDFGLDAVEGTCTGEGISAGEVPDLLADLVDKSLLLRHEHHGEGRFRLLETLRQFGQEKLGEYGQRELMLARHRDWYQRLADQALAEWFGPRQTSWFSRLRLERANLRGALEYCLSEPGEAESGLRMASALLRPFWLPNAFFSEGRMWLGRLLEKAPAAGAPRAKGLCANAWLALLQGDAATALSMLDEGGRLADQLDDPASIACVLYLSGLAALYLKDEPEGTRLLREAVQHHARIGDAFGIAMSSIALAVSLGEDGDSDQAVALCEQSLALTVSRGETWCRSYALRTLAIETWHRGETALAASLAREGLLASRTFDDRFGMAVDVDVLGWIAAGPAGPAGPVGPAGDPRRAALLMGAAEAIARTVGASGLRIGIYVGHHERCRARVKAALGSQEFARAFADGARLTLEQAVAEALADATGAPRRVAQRRPPPRKAAPRKAAPRRAPAGEASSGRPAPASRAPLPASPVTPSPLTSESVTPSSARRGSPPSRLASESLLTRRETEIAELVANGLSNKAIAAALVISQRTAEGHVENILSKLGFTSRAQIAAWVTARKNG